MASLSVSGICRLTRDAEARKSNTGTWFSFGIAVYRKNPKEGKQSVDFFDADLYQKQPPPGFESKLKKGKLLYIENAYLRNDQFTGTDGKEKSRVKIQISTFELLNDSVGPTDRVPEPPKYEKSVPSSPVQKTVPQTIHPTDLPPPIKEQKASYLKQEETIPEFQDEEEPPF